MIFYLLYFIWKVPRDRGKPPICKFKYMQYLELGQAEAKSWKQSESPMEVEVIQVLKSSPIASQGKHW